MKTFLTCMMAAFLMTSCVMNGESLSKAITTAIENADSKGPKDSIDYDVAGFASLQFDAVGSIIYTQGEACGIRAIGDSTLISKTSVSVEDGKLIIKIEKNTNTKSGKVKFYVTAPALYDIEINGVGAFQCNGPVDIDGDVAVDIDGVGAIELENFTCNNLKFSHKGVGAAELKVKCGTFDYKHDGVGAAELDVDVETLNIVSEGVGAVEIKGKAHNYNKKKSSIVSAVDDKKLTVE